jgi:hypothetical protein
MAPPRQQRQKDAVLYTVSDAALLRNIGQYRPGQSRRWESDPTNRMTVDGIIITGVRANAEHWRSARQLGR